MKVLQVILPCALLFGGINWWLLPDGVSLDAPPVNGGSGEFHGTTSPILLNPGESFLLYGFTDVVKITTVRDNSSRFLIEEPYTETCDPGVIPHISPDRWDGSAFHVSSLAVPRSEQGRSRDVLQKTNSGGSIFVTGHDPVWHAHMGGNRAGAKNLALAAVSFARNGSSLPFLFVESISMPVPRGNAHEAPYLTSALGFSRRERC